MECLDMPIAESYGACSQGEGAVTCPFYDGETTLCAASLSTLVVSRLTQAALCSSDDYDNCPLFLAKALRMSAAETPLEAN